MLSSICWSRPAIGSAYCVELPVRAVGASGAVSTGWSAASSLMIERRCAICSVRVAASAWPRPLFPISHQKSPCAPSTMAMIACARFSSYVGQRLSDVNLKNCRTPTVGRVNRCALFSIAIVSATWKWL